MYWSHQKQQLIDQLNISLEARIFLLRADKDLSVCLRLLLEEYYKDTNYRMRKSLGGTTEFEDWVHGWKETKALLTKT